jgi:hypothetical protein
VELFKKSIFLAFLSGLIGYNSYNSSDFLEKIGSESFSTGFLGPLNRRLPSPGNPAQNFPFSTALPTAQMTGGGSLPQKHIGARGRFTCAGASPAELGRPFFF